MCICEDEGKQAINECATEKAHGIRKKFTLMLRRNSSCKLCAVTEYEAGAVRGQLLPEEAPDFGGKFLGKLIVKSRH